jgi:antitoxin (DNA-binding transcriptional repressor) of toxin-antitoxin stability system
MTKRNKPVAALSPYRPPFMTPEREKAIQQTEQKNTVIVTAVRQLTEEIQLVGID